LGDGFVLGDIRPVVQDLRQQAQRLATVGADRQAVVADVAAVRALADLTQLGTHFGPRGVVQLGGIMNNHHRGVGQGGDLFASGGGVAGHDDLMGDLGAIHEPVQGPQLGRDAEFFRQRPAGMALQLIRQRDQPLGASSIAQLQLSKVAKAKRSAVFHALPSKVRRRVPPASRLEYRQQRQGPRRANERKCKRYTPRAQERSRCQVGKSCNHKLQAWTVGPDKKRISGSGKT
jgi:hypothetical protein